MSKTYRYIIALTCMLLFTVSDLVFDYGFDFKSSDYISLLFTIASAMIVFICTGKLAKDKYYQATKFIRSNFDKIQVIFSALDIFCGIISIIAGLTFLFTTKIFKFIYIPIKLLDVGNKLKSISKPVVKFSLMWTATRMLKGEKMTFGEFIKANKWTLLTGFIVGLVIALGVYAILPKFLAMEIWLAIVVSTVAGVLAFCAVFFVGNDTMKSLSLRLAEKTLNKDKYEQLVNVYKTLQEKENEENAILEKATEQLKAEEKAKKKEEKLKKKDAKKEIKEQEVKLDEEKQKEFDEKVQEKIRELKAQEIHVDNVQNNSTPQI